MANDAKHRQVLRLDPKIKEPKQFMLDKTGRLAGKYKLTRTGGMQLANAMGRGMYQLILDLDSDQDPDINHTLSPKILASTLNSLIRLRKSRIARHKAIVCDERNELDGFVASSYQLVSNEKIFRHYEQACELVGKFRFHSAYLSGLEMTVLLMPTDAKPWGLPGTNNARFQTGLVLQNSETAGRSVRATLAYIDTITRSWSCASWERENKVQHRKGKVFQQKIMMMGDSLAHTYRNNKVSRRMWSFLESDISKYKRHHEGSCYGWILRNSPLSPKSVDSLTRSALSGIDESLGTPWEIYQALLSEADKLPVSKSIALRQAAGLLLSK
ncbi:MAG: hypothetical protein ACR2M9_01855 [Cyanophyceae cyanobacterium]